MVLGGSGVFIDVDTLTTLVAYAVVCVGLLLGSYYLLDLLTPGKLTRLIKDGGWNAALLATANAMAVAVIIASAMFGQRVTLAGLLTAAVFAVIGTVFQAIGLSLIRVVWLAKDNMHDLLAAPRVTPAGAFLAAMAFALGISIAVAVH